MNRADWQELTDIRIAEAHALLTFTPPMPDEAYYLAGYAVECALKAAICRLTKEFDWPDKKFAVDCFTHDISSLVRLASLDSDRAAEGVANPVFQKNWNTAKDWDEKSRYERNTLLDAQKLIAAITAPVNGVLPWIKARW